MSRDPAVIPEPAPSTKEGADAWFSRGREVSLEARIEANKSIRYSQLPRTHSSVPEVDGPPDQDKHPGQEKGWSDIGFALPANMPLAIEVHEYLSPLGPGFDVLLWAKDSGVEAVRVISFGPERGRAHDWVSVMPAEPSATEKELEVRK